MSDVLKQRWRVSTSFGASDIETETGDFVQSDLSSKRLAQHIVDLHNASLATELMDSLQNSVPPAGGE